MENDKWIKLDSRPPIAVEGRLRGNDSRKLQTPIIIEPAA